MKNINYKKLLIPNIPYVFIALFATKLGQAARLAPGFDFSSKVLNIMQGFSMAFENIMPSFHPVDLLVGIAAAVFLKLAVYIKGKNAKKFRKNLEYGSARWGTREDMLNHDGVPTPMLYKRAAGCSRDRWPSIHEENFWTQGNIFKILRDERYIGKCVYGKRERDMVGNWHTIKKSKSDWIVVDETHEGIVSKELFRTVASRMKEYKEFVPSSSERNPLRRKVICGTCGFAMSLSNTKNAKYHCRTSHLETGFNCTSEGILQADIHEMVVTLIRTYAAYAVSLEHLLLLQKERIQAEKKQARRELAVLQSRRNQLEKSLQDLYEKLIDGTIDKETYLSQKASNQAQMQELTEKMERLEKSSQTTTEQGGAFIEKYKEYTELETLNAEIANDVVKRVTVYKDGGIEIELALRDELEELLNCLETVDAAS